MTFSDVEAAREKYRAKIKKVWCITLPVLAALLAVIIILNLGGFPISLPSLFGGHSSGWSLTALIPRLAPIVTLLFFAIVISYIVVRIATYKEAKAYRSAYKTYFVEQSLNSVFTDLRYEPNSGLSPTALRGTSMINTGDRYHSNDLMMARYKNVSFTGADAHIEEEYTDSDGDTHYTTIFHGRFMLFEFPKKFDFKLELIGRSFRAYKIPGKNPTTGRKMTKISTESNDFNKTFKILGEDGFEAYYLLDPATMERLMALAGSHSGKILFGFTDNILLVAIDGAKDSFEPPSARHPLDEAAETAKVGRDIKVITDLIDNLKLHRK